MHVMHAYLVAAANQWPACDVQESHILGNLLPLVKLGRLDIAVDLHVTLGGSHVLAECYDIDVRLAEVFQAVSTESRSMSRL